MQIKRSGFRIGPEDSDIAPHRWSGETYALENLRLSHTLNESELLALLNGEAVYPHTDSRRLLRAPGENERIAEEQLRDLVDEWIDSAIDENGTEQPARRRHQKDGLARLAFLDYSKSLRMLVSENGSVVLLGAPPQLPFTEDEPVYGGLGDTSRNHSEWLDHRKSAQAFFVSMMLSPTAQRIAKCRTPGCGRYFLIKHPNHPYIGGTHCPEHKGKQKTEISRALTAAGRQEAYETLYAFCVEKFGVAMRKSGWQNSPALIQRMVVEVNMHIAGDPNLRAVYPKGITNAWFRRVRNREGLAASLTAQGPLRRRDGQKTAA